MKLLTVVVLVYSFTIFLETETRDAKRQERISGKFIDWNTDRGRETRADLDGCWRRMPEMGGMKLRVPCKSENTARCGRRLLENSRFRRETEANATLFDTIKAQFKIKGGHLAGRGMYPWQARIYTREGHLCGGTIISNYWILSAAHCFAKVTKADVLVNVGDYSIDYLDEGEQTFQVEEIIMHVDYDPSNFDYDIALLRVKPRSNKGIVFNSYVQAACLPSSHITYTSRTEDCFVSGWGKTGQGDSSPRLLMAGSIRVLQQTECRSIYKEEITPRMFCASDPGRNIDTCKGDSGGPLVCRINGLYTVVGVTSWGRNCSGVGSVGVYTNVVRLLSWISRTLQKYS